MKEHPILFSGEMVRAILEGYKTMTRRVIKPQPDFPVFVKKAVCSYDDESSYYCWWLLDSLDLTIDDCSFLRCPYGVPGDHLWVRETWGDLTAAHPRCKDGRKPVTGDRLVYRANPADDYQWGSEKPSRGDFCWRPSIFMPRWASRITLEITNIRVERLQDITEKDAKAEGINDFPYMLEGDSTPKLMESTYVWHFRDLWDKLNSKRGYGWEKNPWVWGIEFKRVEK